MTKDIAITEYKHLLEESKQTILEAQHQFLRDANRTNIDLYWRLGKLLSKAADRYQWGKQIVARLSHDLTLAFSNTKGYSEQNLRHMRQFYAEYLKTPDLLEIAKTVRWSTNLIIMYKVKDIDQRHFYLKLASDTMCSRHAIEIQIKSGAYERERLQKKKHNFQSTLPDHLAAKADNLLKAGYFLEVNKPFCGSHSLLEITN